MRRYLVIINTSYIVYTLKNDFCIVDELNLIISFCVRGLFIGNAGFLLLNCKTQMGVWFVHETD
jgi:hypothetical protein